MVLRSFEGFGGVYTRTPTFGLLVSGSCTGQQHAALDRIPGWGSVIKGCLVIVWSSDVF